MHAVQPSNLTSGTTIKATLICLVYVHFLATHTKISCVAIWNEATTRFTSAGTVQTKVLQLPSAFTKVFATVRYVYGGVLRRKHKYVKRSLF